MKKICMVTGLAGPGSVAGGVWEVVANQSYALVQAGYDVSIVAGWLGGDPPDRIRGLPVELIPVRPLVKSLGLRAVFGRGWDAALKRALMGADVAHVHLCRDYLTMSATRTISRLGVPIVAQTHGMLETSTSPGFEVFDHLITKSAIRRVRHFITLTDAEKPSLGEFGVPWNRLTTIENGVPDPGHPWLPDGGTHRLLFVSRLHPRKQVMVFAEVVAQLRANGLDVEGVIAGPDQGDLQALQQFIRSGAHQPHLRYIGEVDRDQLIDELTHATALVFPARDEPFGLVLIEAMAVGTPVVSSDETPLASAMSAAVAALVAHPDVASLTAATDRLLRDTELQLTLAHNGRALYEANWTNEAMVKRLIDLYRNGLNWAPIP